MLYLVKKFSSYSPKISKIKLVTHLDKIRSALTGNLHIPLQFGYTNKLAGPNFEGFPFYLNYFLPPILHASLSLMN